MRLLFVASLVSVVAITATFACSSSNPATGTADAGKDAKAAPQTTEDDDDDKQEIDPPAVTDDAGASDASDASTTSSGGPLTTEGDGGKACGTDSLREAEPNNDVATANTIPESKTYAFCGTVIDTDTDVFTFTTPEFDSGFGVTPSGDNVKYKIQIGEKTFDGFPKGGFGNIQVGDKWIITVSTGSATTRNYALKVQFN